MFLDKRYRADEMSMRRHFMSCRCKSSSPMFLADFTKSLAACLLGTDSSLAYVWASTKSDLSAVSLFACSELKLTRPSSPRELREDPFVGSAANKLPPSHPRSAIHGAATELLVKQMRRAMSRVRSGASSYAYARTRRPESIQGVRSVSFAVRGALVVESATSVSSGTRGYTRCPQSA